MDLEGRSRLDYHRCRECGEDLSLRWRWCFTCANPTCIPRRNFCGLRCSRCPLWDYGCFCLDLSPSEDDEEETEAEADDEEDGEEHEDEEGTKRFYSEPEAEPLQQEPGAEQGPEAEPEAEPT